MSKHLASLGKFGAVLVIENQCIAPRQGGPVARAEATPLAIRATIFAAFDTRGAAPRAASLPLVPTPYGVFGHREVSQ